MSAVCHVPKRGGRSGGCRAGGVARAVRRLASLLAFVGLAASAPSLARAEPPTSGVASPAPVMPTTVPSRVTVGVMAIQATSEPGPIDERLRPLLSALQALPFKSFQLLDTREVLLRDASHGDLRLAGGRTLTVHLVSHDDKQAQVRVELVTGDKKVLDSTVVVRRNLTFNLAVRTTTGALVVPITVRY